MKSFIKRHRRLTAVAGFVSLLALFGLIATIQFNRPIPEVTVVRADVEPPPPPAAADIAWPEFGQASVAIRGAGVISESPDQQPQAIASLAKVMTAYVILKNHPLNPGEAGPDVEFTEQHVTDYLARRANAESVVPVAAGAKMTLRELLRGLLLASGNNVADILAEWHAGSVESFVAEMNAEARSLGMSNTIYADAAGLLSASISTAHDQLILAQAAMSDPTFASIVREAEAILPGAGLVFNTNASLGTDGIVGIKTGWTEEAGACFVFAAESELQGQSVTVVGAVLGQDTLADAFERAQGLIARARDNVRVVEAGAEGEVVGQVKTRWGTASDLVLTQDVGLLLLPGMEIERQITLTTEGNKIAAGSEAGSIRFSAGDQTIEVPLTASSAVDDPSLFWRLTRIR